MLFIRRLLDYYLSHWDADIHHDSMILTLMNRLR